MADNWHWTHQFEEAMQYIREESLSVHTKPTHRAFRELGEYACTLARRDHSVKPILEYGDTPAESIVSAYNEWRRLAL